MTAQLTTTIPIKDQQGNVIGEKEVATYAGLLARAHEEGLKSIQTELVQLPTPDNGRMAVAKAVVETAKGVYTGIGDASPDNVNRRIAPHIIRMAETRAKARALRDAVNIGVVSLEELGGDESEGLIEPLPERSANVRPLRPSSSERTGEAQRGQQNGNGQRMNRSEGTNGRSDSEGSAMTEAQRRLLYRLLSENGYEGDDATRVLLEAARVSSLRDMSRNLASKVIDAWRRREAVNA